MTNNDSEDLASRITALEHRVSALETSGPGGATPRAADDEPAPDDTLWALNELRRRESGAGAVLMVGSVEVPAGGTAVWQLGARTEDLLDDDWEELAARLDALAHPIRLRILKEVLHGRSTAKELTTAAAVGSQGQVYHHLRALTSTGWLRVEHGGRHTVPVERVVPLLTMLLGARG